MTTPGWFAAHRRVWIANMLQVYGFLNRDHLCRQFGISVPQASIDLHGFLKAHPGVMTYDLSRKCYVATGARPIDTFLTWRREAQTHYQATTARTHTTKPTRRRRSGGARKDSGASASVTLPHRNRG